MHLFNSEATKATAEKRQKQIDDVKARALRSNLSKSLKNIIDKTTFTYKEDASYTFLDGEKGSIYGANYGDTIDLTSKIWSLPRPGNSAASELVDTFFHEVQHSIDVSFEHNYDDGVAEAAYTKSYRGNVKTYYQTR